MRISIAQRNPAFPMGQTRHGYDSRRPVWLWVCLVSWAPGNLISQHIFGQGLWEKDRMNSGSLAPLLWHDSETSCICWAWGDNDCYICVDSWYSGQPKRCSFSSLHLRDCPKGWQDMFLSLSLWSTLTLGGIVGPKHKTERWANSFCLGTGSHRVRSMAGLWVFITHMSWM